VNTGSRGVTGAAAYFSLAQQLLPDSTCATRRQFDIIIGGHLRRCSVGSRNWAAAALLKALWWDLRLASLLTHLFI